jgi:hypothetical protein
VRVEEDPTVAKELVLAEGLRRVSDALLHLQRSMERLYPLIGNNQWDAIARDARQVVAVQSIDYLEQSLRVLAGFVRELARQTPAEWRIDARSAFALITLSELASRMRHGETIAPARPAGDCELL